MGRRAPVGMAGTGASALACLPLAALLACLPLAPDPTVNLRWNVAAEGEEEPSPARAIGGRATLTVTGRIRASLPCDPLEGDLVRSGERLRLVVTVRGGVNSCPGGVVTYAYVASLVNLEAGRRSLTVEHRFEGPARPPEVVFEGPVEVG